MRYAAGLLILALAGCSTLTTKAETTGADGASQKLIQRDIVAPFAKRAEGVGQMSTHLGADGSYDVTTGQHALGTDNTPQSQALQAVIQAVMGAFTQYLVAHPAQAPVEKPTFLEQLSPELLRFTPPVTK